LLHEGIFAPVGRPKKHHGLSVYGLGDGRPRSPVAHGNCAPWAADGEGSPFEF
jgi:hypothetical protein